MLFVRKACLINYDLLCNQTVTVYRKIEDGAICKEFKCGEVACGGKFCRRVYKKAFLDFKKTVSVDKLGASEATSFLLVIPGNEQAVYPGDKVLLGVGPQISSSDVWSKEFIPTKVNGLVVVKYADVKYWNGEIVHTEAGG